MVHEPAHRNYSECPKQLEAIALKLVNSRAAIVGMGGLIGLTLVSGFWFDQVPERVTPTQMVELTHQVRHQTRFGNNGLHVGDPDVIG